jgi:CubicO group peptidase (beta-lactamase class C family)
MRIVGVLLALLGWSAAAAADGLSPAQIEEISAIAREARDTRHLPAISITVARDGKLWSGAFGSADLEQDVAASTHSLFRTASIGKWFTATAAMRLAEDGTLDLDSPVQKYCPPYPTKPWPVTSRVARERVRDRRRGENAVPPGRARTRVHARRHAVHHG